MQPLPDKTLRNIEAELHNAMPGTPPINWWRSWGSADNLTAVGNASGEWIWCERLVERRPTPNVPSVKSERRRQTVTSDCAYPAQLASPTYTDSGLTVYRAIPAPWRVADLLVEAADAQTSQQANWAALHKTSDYFGELLAEIHRLRPSSARVMTAEPERRMPASIEYQQVLIQGGAVPNDLVGAWRTLCEAAPTVVERVRLALERFRVCTELVRLHGEYGPGAQLVKFGPDGSLASARVIRWECGFLGPATFDVACHLAALVELRERRAQEHLATEHTAQELMTTFVAAYESRCGRRFNGTERSHLNDYILLHLAWHFLYFCWQVGMPLHQRRQYATSLQLMATHAITEPPDE